MRRRYASRSGKPIIKLQQITHPRITTTSRRSCCSRGHACIRRHIPLRNLFLDETAQPRESLEHSPSVVFPNIVASGRDMRVRARFIKPGVIVGTLEGVVVPLAGEAAEGVVWLFRLGFDDGFEAGDGEGGVCC